jgi:hypothetical protein
MTHLQYILDPLVVKYRFQEAQTDTNDTYFMPIWLMTVIYSTFVGVSIIYGTGKKTPEHFRMICQQRHLSDHLGEPNIP